MSTASMRPEREDKQAWNVTQRMKIVDAFVFVYVSGKNTNTPIGAPWLTMPWHVAVQEFRDLWSKSVTDTRICINCTTTLLSFTDPLRVCISLYFIPVIHKAFTLAWQNSEIKAMFQLFIIKHIISFTFLCAEHYTMPPVGIPKSAFQILFEF